MMLKSFIHASTQALIFGCVVLASGLSVAQTVQLDRIAAIVEDDVVMESELKQQMAQIKQRLAQSEQAQLPPDSILQNQVLEHLISQRLQLQRAERVGIEISDEEVNATIEQMRQANGLSPEQFEQQLQMQGMGLEALQEEIRRELLITRVQRGFLNSRIKVTDQDVQHFLASKEGRFWTSPDLRLGHILISVSNSAPESTVNEAKQKAQGIYEQLQNGADFAELAVTHSAAQNALDGGDLGWRKAAELPEIFAENLTDTKAGDITPPFRSGAGFHILKVHEQRGGGETLVEQTHVRHILLQPTAILSSEEAEQRLRQAREKILAGADFAELAKELSADPGSKLAGGDLGWALPGQFVPQFEQTMNKTAEGEISEPFLTEHGWHILQVLGRREQDMSDTVKRNQARNLLRNRRFEEELPIWLQEIRDEAFVEIKLDHLKNNPELAGE